MSHTPGPWSVSPDGVCIVGPGTSYTTHTDEAGKTFEHPDKLIALPYGCRPGTREENARLIAAAPSLLEALRAMVGRFGGSGTCVLDELAIKGARAAIEMVQP